MSRPIRVLVVDDSAFARKVIRETLSKDARIDVVGIACDGLEALERIAALKPDVITLDLVMPHLDGLGLLQTLTTADRPRVVVVSIAERDSELGVAALRAGALELVHKPTAHASDRLYDLGDELIAKVIAAAGARLPDLAPVAPRRVLAQATTKRIVLVGTSTGGPQALSAILGALPASYPVPIAAVIHMPTGYTAPFARRLDDECAVHVVEAEDGLAMTPGMVAIGRAGVHFTILRVGAGFQAVVGHELSGSMHRPSVDVLFQSLAHTDASDVLGVILTGMGADGLEGSRALIARGASILVEAESSCVMYGMPRCVKEAGLATAEAPLAGIVEAMSRLL